MMPILDQQVAARIQSECRDVDPVQRFQRAAYIVESLLEPLGLPETAKALRKLRIAVGLIRETKDLPPDPLPSMAHVEPEQKLPGLLLPEVGDQADILTGRKRRKAVR